MGLEKRLIIGLLALSTVFSSCNKSVVSYSKADYGLKSDYGVLDDCDFSYGSALINPLIDHRREKEYDVDKISFSSVSNSYKNETAVCYYFHKKGDRPKIVFYTILGDSKIISDMVVDRLIGGFDLLCMKGKQGMLWYENGIEFSSNLVKEQVIDTRRLMDWLDKDKKNEYGVIGLSTGGIFATVLAGVDSRIEGGAMVYSGGDLGLILSTTEQDYVSEFREYVMKKNGFTADEFVSEVRRLSKCIEPLNYAGKLDPSKFVIVYGTDDKVIRPQSSQLLFEKMNNPMLVEVKGSHFDMNYTDLVCNKISAKLKEVFNCHAND